MRIFPFACDLPLPYPSELFFTHSSSARLLSIRKHDLKKSLNFNRKDYDTDYDNSGQACRIAIGLDRRANLFSIGALGKSN